jgi:hypothetical protein
MKSDLSDNIERETNLSFFLISEGFVVCNNEDATLLSMSNETRPKNV